MRSPHTFVLRTIAFFAVGFARCHRDGRRSALGGCTPRAEREWGARVDVVLSKASACSRCRVEDAGGGRGSIRSAGWASGGTGPGTSSLTARRLYGRPETRSPRFSLSFLVGYQLPCARSGSTPQTTYDIYGQWGLRSFVLVGPDFVHVSLARRSLSLPLSHTLSPPSRQAPRTYDHDPRRT